MEALGPGRMAVVRPHYPHMMAEDTSVWTKFLKSGVVNIQEVWYDVRVGMAVVGSAIVSEMDRRIAAGLTRKRIDAVCRVGGGLWVVEVKPYANMYAVGQVLTYARLFAKEYVSSGEVLPVIVCDDYDVDLLDEFDEFGVLVLQNE